MCLAVPAKVVERDGEQAWVDLAGTRVRVSLVLTPDVQVGDYVLVHAGFAIEHVDEQEARETWELLETVHPDSVKGT